MKKKKYNYIFSLLVLILIIPLLFGAFSVFGSKTTTTSTLVTNNNEYVAVVSAENCSVTFKNSNNEEVESFLKGLTYSINIVPDEHYEIDNITVNNIEIENNATFICYGNIDVKVIIILDKFNLSATGSNITYSIARGGTAVNLGTDTITYGDLLTITATADNGFELSTLTVNGVDFVNGSIYTVSGNLAIVGTATPLTYDLSATGSNLTYSITRGGIAVNLGTDTITYGDLLTITATADIGYSLNSLTVNGTAFTSGNTYTVNGNVDIVASASIIGYTLDLSFYSFDAHCKYDLSCDGGLTWAHYDSDSISGNVSYENITHIKLLAIFVNDDGECAYYQLNNGSNINFEFDLDCIINLTQNSSLFVSVVSLPSYNLSATGSNLTYTITRGGTALNFGYTILHGDILTITATADIGYSLNSLTVNGVDFVNGSIYTVNDNVAIVGTVTPITYDLSYSGSNINFTITRGGNMVISGTDRISHGDVLTITATANLGYSINTLTVNGTEFISGQTYTVNGDVSIVGTVTLTTYDLSYSGSNINYTITRGGIVVNPGTDRISHGDLLTITATADIGYSLDLLTVNGNAFTSGNTYRVFRDVVIVGTASAVSTGYTITLDAGSRYDSYNSYTYLKINTAPINSNDYDVNSYELPNDNTFSGVSKIFVWGASVDVDGTTYQLYYNSHTTFNTALEINITSNCNVTIYCECD